MAAPEPRFSGHYPAQAPIDAYGNGGFRFAGMSHRGSIVCLPGGISAWAPASLAALTVEALAPILAERGRFSLLLLGTGAAHLLPGAAVRKALADAGVGLEVMATGAACRTYNVLLGEKRAVAAALIALD